MTILLQISDLLSPLIIAAILSLIGGVIGVLFNFISNIKTNNSQIAAEEKKAKLSYQREILEKLFDAYKELQEKKGISIGNKSHRKLMDEAMESNSFAMKKLKEIEPFLMKTDRDKLISRYEDISKKHDEVQVKILMNSSANADECEKIISEIGMEETMLKQDCMKALTNEMTLISDAIRNQMDVVS